MYCLSFVFGQITERIRTNLITVPAYFSAYNRQSIPIHHLAGMETLHTSRKTYLQPMNNNDNCSTRTVVERWSIKFTETVAHTQDTHCGLYYVFGQTVSTERRARTWHWCTASITCPEEIVLYLFNSDWKVIIYYNEQTLSNNRSHYFSRKLNTMKPENSTQWNQKTQHNETRKLNTMKQGNSTQWNK